MFVCVRQCGIDAVMNGSHCARPVAAEVKLSCVDFCCAALVVLRTASAVFVGYFLDRAEWAMLQWNYALAVYVERSMGCVS